MGVTTTSTVAGTYTPIATQTLNSNSTTVTFSSIPQTYTDLILVINGSATYSPNYWTLRFNSDTGSNYSSIYERASGSSAQAKTDKNQTYLFTSYGSPISTAANAATLMINIMSYTNTNFHKTTIARDGNGQSGFETDLSGGIWKSTSAITQIDIGVGANQIASGTMLTLYGIKAA